MFIFGLVNEVKAQDPTFSQFLQTLYTSTCNGGTNIVLESV